MEFGIESLPIKGIRADGQNAQLLQFIHPHGGVAGIADRAIALDAFVRANVENVDLFAGGVAGALHQRLGCDPTLFGRRDLFDKIETGRVARNLKN